MAQRPIAPTSELVFAARSLALSAHAGMSRNNAARDPACAHLAEVAAFVAKHGGAPVAIAAAWLHDVAEDTPTTLDEVARLCGSETARIVKGLTDPPGFSEMGLAERKAAQALRIAAKCRWTQLCKIGDQASNLLSVERDPPEGWGPEECSAYALGAKAVVDACRASWPQPAREFDKAFAACMARRGSAREPAAKAP